MLANAVVISAYAGPLIWCCAFVAMWAEVKTVLWVLRRGGGDVRGMLALLFAVKARPAVADAIVVPGKLASFVVK